MLVNTSLFAGWDRFSGYVGYVLLAKMCTPILPDVSNGMLGSHQRHQLYETCLHMTSTERDTVERFWGKTMCCEGMLLVGARMPSSNPITKLIVTKLITKVISGAVIP